ncbi:winged helix family transcriptional regulator [Enterobacteriaceae bacterium 89]|nr:winged helix family transcriptional regulator [Enterobacteriaceae bacterium 89]
MVYLIDTRVRYRPEDGSLWLSEDEHSAVTLTMTMNRLLAFVLEKRGQVLTRNELLEGVWDAHGLRSSNHTLNKYISELRKHFVQFGITQECIITVPRVGFIFNGDIAVEIIESTASEKTAKPKHATDDDFKEHNVHREGKEHIAAKTLAATAGVKYFVLSFLTLLICSLLISAQYWYPARIANKPKDMSTYHLFDYETCPVNTIQQNSIALSETKKKMFTELVTKEGILCLNGSTFLFQVSESYLYGKKGRAFISRCTSKESHYISCQNFYWSGYASNE